MVMSKKMFKIIFNYIKTLTLETLMWLSIWMSYIEEYADNDLRDLKTDL